MSKEKTGLAEIGKPKKPSVHLHTGTPAVQLFNKMTRATCGWVPKLESALIEAERKSSHVREGREK